MSPEQRSEIRSLLESARDEIISRKHDLSVPTEIETMDRAVEVGRMETEARAAEADAVKLKQIRNALHDVDLDYFGVCCACEKAIGIRRLRAVPWATLCRDCQTAAEERR